MSGGGLLRRAIACALLAFLIFRLVYVWRQQNPYDNSFARVQAAGVLRVGIDPTNPPFAFYAEGQIIGLEIDLANEIARRLGAKMQIVALGIDSLYDSLADDQADVLIAAVSFDPLRFGRFLYTRPYVDAGQVIVSTRGDLLNMQDLEGKQTAVEYGSIADEVLRVWGRRLYHLPVTRFNTPQEALQAVIQGHAEAALTDYVTARLFIRAHPEVPLVVPTVVAQPQTYSAVTVGRARALAGAINAILEQMDDDGTLAAILAKWL
jgi:ABC-type amino acid transport substrate-binding protein